MSARLLSGVLLLTLVVSARAQKVEPPAEPSVDRSTAPADRIMVSPDKSENLEGAGASSAPPPAADNKRASGRDEHAAPKEGLRGGSNSGGCGVTRGLRSGGGGGGGGSYTPDGGRASLAWTREKTSIIAVYDNQPAMPVKVASYGVVRLSNKTQAVAVGVFTPTKSGDLRTPHLCDVVEAPTCGNCLWQVWIAEKPGGPAICGYPAGGNQAYLSGAVATTAEEARQYAGPSPQDNVCVLKPHTKYYCHVGAEPGYDADRLGCCGYLAHDAYNNSFQFSEDYANAK